jgi:ABC-type branched-subunit amino acid transport system ATPase component
MSTLVAEELCVFYGQAQAVHNATLSAVSPGVTSLIGRNGVGKTTTLRAIMGLQHVQRGRVHLDGVDLTRLPPHKRAALGIRLVPQEQVVYPGLTVREHLALARVTRTQDRRRETQAADDDREQWLRLFPVLGERGSQRADTLSGGERKMLAIAQALVGGAEFLLMDEPTEGVQPSMVELIAQALATIAERRGILLVEQNLDVISYLGGTGYVMEKGAIAASGSIEDLERSGRIDKYLSV